MRNASLYFDSTTGFLRPNVRIYQDSEITTDIEEAIKASIESGKAEDDRRKRSASLAKWLELGILRI